MADGRWDLGALVKRESREEERTGPNRPIEIQSIEVIDGRVSLQNPLDFGAAHVPTDFQSLNALFSFTYVPVRWTLEFDRVSWVGHAPDLSVNPAQRRFRPRAGRMVFRGALGEDRAVRVHAGRPRQHHEADVARPARARAAIRLSGMVRRPARAQEHRRRSGASTRRSRVRSISSRPTCASPGPAARCTDA